MIAETIAGAAIVAAVVFAVCLVRAMLPGPRTFPGVERLTVLRGSGDAVGLEAAVRELRPYGTVYILDAGMTPEARYRARLLSERFGARLFGEHFSEETEDTDGR